MCRIQLSSKIVRKKYMKLLYSILRFCSIELLYSILRFCSIALTVCWRKQFKIRRICKTSSTASGSPLVARMNGFKEVNRRKPDGDMQLLSSLNAILLFGIV